MPVGTVGDLIMNVRSLGPDNPTLTLGIPTASAATPGSPVGGTLPVGAYFFRVTQLNAWGESLASVEQPVTIGGGQTGFTVTVTPDIGATTVRVYLGTVAGSENRYQLFTGITAGAANVLSFTNVGVVVGQPPVNSSAFIPDSDGSFVSASTMYRWLNDALKAAARTAGSWILAIRLRLFATVI